MVLIIISVLFGAAATAAGVLAADRMHVMVTLTSSASVSDLMLPTGHWIMTAAWMAAAVLVSTANRRDVIYRCVAVGIALHMLILVALFVGKLSDRDAFSARAYLLYAQLFCMTVLAIAAAWSIRWMQRLRQSVDDMTALEAPLLVGAAALAVILARHNALMAAAALGAGVLLAAAVSPGLTRAMSSLAANETAFLAIVFCVALGLRLLYVQRIMADPNYLDTGADGRAYDTLAWQIAGGDGIPAAFSTRYPLLLLGYVWFLAAIYAVFGHSYAVAVTVQSILGAAAAVIVYFIGKQIFGEAVGRVAAAFTALSFSLIFAAAALGHQALDVFITALLVLVLLRVIGERRRLWPWAATGALIGIAVAVRETAIFFAAFIAVWMAFMHPKGWRASLPAMAAYAAGAAIVVMPFVAPKIWTADSRRNMRVHFDRLYRGQAEAQPIRGELAGPLADPRAALPLVTSSPGHVMATLARAYTNNFAVQFLTQPYGGFDLVFLRKGTEYYYGMWFYAYALAVAGTIAAVRMAWTHGAAVAGVTLVLGLIASRTIPHIILESDYRHRVPVEPFLILLASVGAVQLWQRVSASSRPWHAVAK